MQRKLVLFLFLVTPFMAYSQSPSSLVEKFFQEFAHDGASVALDNLYATNPWMERNQDAVTNLKSKLEGLNEDFVGKFYGYDLIAEKSFGDRYILLSYLIRYDRQPIRFTFQFYRPDKEWRVYGFQFDGDFTDEMKEALKAYYLD